jgi:hypothetical protein
MVLAQGLHFSLDKWPLNGCPGFFFKKDSRQAGITKGAGRTKVATEIGH